MLEIVHTNMRQSGLLPSGTPTGVEHAPDGMALEREHPGAVLAASIVDYR
jgi:hypothetical protein